MVLSESSANQLWKQQIDAGKTTLPFLSWLEREKMKAFYSFDGDETVKIPLNKPLNDSVQATIKQLHVAAGEKTEAGTEYFLGIKTRYLYASVAVLATATFAVLIHKKVL